MSISLVYELVIIFFLILANGFFAASEIAIVSARRGRLEQQAASGLRGATRAIELAENPNRFLSTVQVGITVIGTFAAAFGGASLADPLQQFLSEVPATAPYATSLSLTLVVILISYLSLIVGELVPKRLALQNAEAIATVVAPVMATISRLASPLVGFLTISTDLVLRLLGRQNAPELPITEEDILALVREGTAEGTVEDSEQELINSVFTFTDTAIRSLMTPRTQITAVELSTPIVEVMRVITESGYSRIPVYQESLDKIVGILFVKDLLKVWHAPEGAQLEPLLRPTPYLIESQRATRAFQQLKQNRSMLAMVLDEYGQVAGLISMEDLLEALVGDIQDEYDEADDSIVARQDGSYLVDGLMLFDKLQAQLHLPALEEPLDTHDFETVAGFLLALMGRIPAAGDIAVWRDYTFEIMDMDGPRIDKILVQPPAPTDPTEALLAQNALLPPPVSSSDTTDPA
jgi:putative hemolysin